MISTVVDNACFGRPLLNEAASWMSILTMKVETGDHMVPLKTLH